MSRVWGPARLGQQQTAQVVIMDDDIPPTGPGLIVFGSETYFVEEGAGQIDIPVLRIGGTAEGDLSVTCRTQSDTGPRAATSDNYDPVASMCSFSSGERESTLSIRIKHNPNPEGDKTVTLLLEGDETILGTRRTATLVILDKELREQGEIRFQQRTFYVREGDDYATIVVDRYGPTDVPVAVNIAAFTDRNKQDHAIPRLDYETTPKTLEFEKGVTSRVFFVPIMDDDLIEPDETIELVLNGARRLDDSGTDTQVQATDPLPLASDVATLSLQDNNPELIGFSEQEYLISEDSVVTITIKRYNESPTPEISLKVYTVDGQARGGFDYTPLPQEGKDVTLSNDTPEQQIQIPILKNERATGNRSFSVIFKVQSPDNFTFFGRDQTTVTIQKSESSGSTAKITGDLIASTTNPMPKQKVFFVADLHTDTPPPTVELQFDNGNTTVLQSNSTIPNLYFHSKPITETTKVSLIINGQTLKTITIEPRSAGFKPKLLILTDWKALYDEFLDTGMTRDSRESEAQSENHDFSELVRRIDQYAQKHDGVVVDLPNEMTGGPNPFLGANLKNYKDEALGYDEGTNQRYDRAVAVDRFITEAFGSTKVGQSIRNIAIIGSDQVVPFYRVYDPTSEYYSDKENTFDRDYARGERHISSNNAILVDMRAGYLMSDLPYGIHKPKEQIHGNTLKQQQPQDPDLTNPVPEVGVGRIFAHKPHELIVAIDRYDTPINASRDAGAKVSVFAAKPDPVLNFDTMIQRNLKNQRKFDVYNLFSKIYWYQSGEWGATEFQRAVRETDVTTIWGHGSHRGFQISSGHWLLHDQSKAIFIEKSKSRLFSAMSCHIGLTMSDHPDNTAKVSDEVEYSFIMPLISNGVTVFASSATAYGAYTTGVENPQYNELMVTQFIDSVVRGDAATIGEAWRKLYLSYSTATPKLAPNERTEQLFHTASGYGMVLYGLPTQPIQRTPEEEAPPRCKEIRTQQAVSQVAPISNPSPHSITISTPTILHRTLPDGKTIFMLPNDNAYLTPDNGPPLPYVAYSSIIPYYNQITDVRLVKREPALSQPSGTFTLATSQLQTSTGTSVDSRYDIPDIYPQIPYTYTVIPQGDGSLLTIKAIPLEYNKHTKTVTFYERMDFEIDFADSSAARATSPQGAASSLLPSKLLPPTTHSTQSGQINVVWADDPLLKKKEDESNHVAINRDRGISLYIEIGSDTPKANQELRWNIYNRNGDRIDSGTQIVRIPTTLECALDTTGWMPGKKPVSVFLEDLINGPVTPPERITITARGPGIIDLEPPPPVLSNDQTEASWRVGIYDHEDRQVASVSSVSSSLPNATLTIEPAATPSIPGIQQLQSTPKPLKFEIESVQNGRVGEYQITLPLDDQVDPGTHVIRMTVKDAEGIQNDKEWIITRDTPHPHHRGPSTFHSSSNPRLQRRLQPPVIPTFHSSSNNRTEDNSPSPYATTAAKSKSIIDSAAVAPLEYSSAIVHLPRSTCLRAISSPCHCQRTCTCATINTTYDYALSYERYVFSVYLALLSYCDALAHKDMSDGDRPVCITHGESCVL